MNIAAQAVIWFIGVVLTILIAASCLSFWYILKSNYAKAFSILRFFPRDNSAAIRPIDITFLAILGGQLDAAEKRLEVDMAKVGVQPLTLSLKILLLSKQGRWDETKGLLEALRQMMSIDKLATEEDTKGLAILTDAVAAKDISRLESLDLYAGYLAGLKNLVKRLLVIISVAVIALIVIMIYEVVS